MQTKKILTWTLALILAVTQTGFASAPKLGTAGAVELLIPMGARNVAMSGANISQVSGTEAIYYNPAGLAIIDGRAEASFSYMNYFADMSVTYLAAGVQAGRAGTFGLTIQSLDIGEIPVTTIDQPEGTGQVLQPSFLTVNASYAKGLSDRINFGANAKLVTEGVGTMKANAVAFDFGLQYVTPWGISMGIAMRNIGGSMSYSGTAVEFDSDVPFANPNATTRKTRLDMADHELPASLNMGASYSLEMGNNHQMNLTGVYGNNSYELDNISVGAEYGLFDMFFVRGGYLTRMYPDDYPGDKEQQFDLSYGFGLKMNISGGEFRFDYANRPMDLFSNVQYFTIGFSL